MRIYVEVQILKDTDDSFCVCVFVCMLNNTLHILREHSVKPVMKHHARVCVCVCSRARAYVCVFSELAYRNCTYIHRSCMTKTKCDALLIHDGPTANTK